jgi:hypothetical protein
VGRVVTAENGDQRGVADRFRTDDDSASQAEAKSKETQEAETWRQAQRSASKESGSLVDGPEIHPELFKLPTMEGPKNSPT